MARARVAKDPLGWGSSASDLRKAVTSVVLVGCRTPELDRLFGVWEGLMSSLNYASCGQAPFPS